MTAQFMLRAVQLNTSVKTIEELWWVINLPIPIASSVHHTQLAHKATQLINLQTITRTGINKNDPVVLPNRQYEF